MKKTERNIEEIKKILKEHKEEVIWKYWVNEIGIFGSFVCGEQKKRLRIVFYVSVIRCSYSKASTPSREVFHSLLLVRKNFS